MRYRQETPSGSTIYYIDKLMEIERAGTSADYRHYLGDIAILTKVDTLSDPNPGIKYLLRDRLGSVAAIGDTTGLSVEIRGSDPFGKPRNGDWTDKSPAILNSTVTDRGFTDHEHLDDWQLIHMNGRGYDYNLGRFLSIDPVIQSSASSQAMNPYIYIGNNPLSGTDPSGYTSKDEVDGDAANEGSVTITSVENEMVAVTGSRIKRHNQTTTTTTTVSTNGDVSVTKSVAVSNGSTWGSSRSFNVVSDGASGGADEIGSINRRSDDEGPITIIPREAEKDERREAPSVAIEDLVIYLGLDLAQSAFENDAKVSGYWRAARGFSGRDMGVIIREGEAWWTSRITEFGYTYSRGSILGADGQDADASAWGGDDQISYVRGAHAITIYASPRRTLDEMNRRRSRYLGMSRDANVPVYVRWGGLGNRETIQLKYFDGSVSLWNPPRSLNQ